MTNKPTKSGFTIVELMVSLAVAAILIGFALPAFTDFIRQRTMTSAVNDFVIAVTYARSEAVRRGETVSVTALGADDANEWGEGYRVVDGDGNVLRAFEALDGLTFDATGADWDDEYQLAFSARGLLTPQPAGPGVIELCSTDATVDPGRQVNMTVVGRPDLEELVCNP